MMQTYWQKGLANRRAVFELYFREMPFGNGYAIFAGLERVIQYVEQLKFSDADIAYLKQTGQFDDDFLIIYVTSSLKGQSIVQWKVSWFSTTNQ
jgi:nicotinate phosphoribosyltransferase